MKRVFFYGVSIFLVGVGGTEHRFLSSCRWRCPFSRLSRYFRYLPADDKVPEQIQAPNTTRTPRLTHTATHFYPPFNRFSSQTAATHLRLRLGF